MLQIYIPKANGLKLLNVHSWSWPGLSSQNASFPSPYPFTRSNISFASKPSDLSFLPIFFIFLFISIYLVRRQFNRAYRSVTQLLTANFSPSHSRHYPFSFQRFKKKKSEASTTHFDLPTCRSCVLIFFPSYSQGILFSTPRESRTTTDIATANKLHRKIKLSLTQDEFKLIRSHRIGRFFLRLRQPILEKK